MHLLPFVVLVSVADGTPFAPRNGKLSIHVTTAFPSSTCCKGSLNLHTGSLNPTSPKSTVFALRGGGAEDAEVAINAFEWCANLGAPAALVAGAVLATLGETRGELSPTKAENLWIRRVKKATRFLLLTAFALEVISIFATTVTGTMLLSHGDRSTGSGAGATYFSSMGFLRNNFEFEYLTARVSFLQGLLNWLAAVALEVVIPNEDEGETARRMNVFISSSLVTLILMMLAFYNNHMTFYGNYAEMLWRYATVTAKKYFSWPLRPLCFLYAPALAFTVYTGWLAFTSPPDVDE